MAQSPNLGREEPKTTTKKQQKQPKLRKKRPSFTFPHHPILEEKKAQN